MDKVISIVLLLTTTACALGQTTNGTNMTSRTSMQTSPKTTISGTEKITTPQGMGVGNTSTVASPTNMSSVDPYDSILSTTESTNASSTECPDTQTALTVGIVVIGVVAALLLVWACVVTNLYCRRRWPWRMWMSKFGKSRRGSKKSSYMDTEDPSASDLTFIAHERTSEYGSDAAGKDRVQVRLTPIASRQAKGMTIEDRGADDVRVREKRRKGKVARNTGSKSFSAIFGQHTVDVFSDITDTSEVLHLCQGYFDDVNQEPVRESIIEKITYIPLGLGGLVNAAFVDEDDDDILDSDSEQQIPSSYYTADTLKTDTSYQRVSEEANSDTLYTVVNETLQTNPVEESAQSGTVVEYNGPHLGMPASHGAPISHPNAADFNRGMFITKTITPSGGRIKLLGVVLDIPTGALSSSKEIRLGIVWQKQILPNLSKKQTLLSPIVVCEPHALRFDKPVKLTLPHCARDMRHSWDITLLKSETSANQVTNWKPLTLEDYDERFIDEGYIEVKLYHFTLYALVGQSKGKACAAKCVNLVAFAPPLQPGKFFKIRLYCTNYYTDFREEEQELEKVRCGEREIGGSRLSGASRLIIHDSGSNLCSSLENLSPGWTPNCEKLEIDFETAWHGFLPSCEFIFKPDGLRDEITCEVKTLQLDRPEKASLISVAEQAKYNLFGKAHLTTFPDELCRFLVIHLDVSSPLHRDWRAAAEHLSMDPALVTWAEQREQSPTLFILQEWEKQKRSLESFYELMRKLDRQDVASEVNKYLASGQRSSNDQPGTTNQYLP